MKVSNHKITGWDASRFDRTEEYGPHNHNARGKRLKFVKSFRKALNRKLRYNKNFEAED